LDTPEFKWCCATLIQRTGGTYYYSLNDDAFNNEGTTSINFTVTGDTATTPEPSGLILLGTGILGLAGAARRKFFC
jgi:hypothetical protein